LQIDIDCKKIVTSFSIEDEKKNWKWKHSIIASKAISLFGEIVNISIVCVERGVFILRSSFFRIVMAGFFSIDSSNASLYIPTTCVVDFSILGRKSVDKIILCVFNRMKFCKY
jgi:hypothetical protein